jgi:hypothetical protein
MKKLLSAAILLALIAVATAQDAAKPDQQPEAAPPLRIIDVYFSPKGGCTEAIVKQIDGAKTEILVQAYSFTSAPIHSPELAAKYVENWEKHLGHSERYEGKENEEK